MRRHLFGIPWIGLLLLLTACTSMQYRQAAQVPPEVFNSPAPPEAEALWAQAEMAYSAGNLALATSTWERIANSFPTNAIAPKALSRVGKLYMSKGRPDTALKYFDAIINNFPQWQNTALAQIDRAEALWAAGNRNEALDEATKLWESPYPTPEFRVRLCAFLARANAEKGDMPTAFKWLDQGFAKAQSPDLTKILNQSALAIVDAMDEATVQRLLSTPTSGNVRPYLEYRLARIQMEQGQQDQARDRLLKILADYPKHPISGEISALFNKGTMIANLKLHPARIGCILPLTGPYADYGRQVLRGLSLAVEDWNNSGSRPVTLIAEDSQAQPQKALQAFRFLAEDQGVLAIVGPLSAKCTNALTPETSKYGIPLLTFTQQESVSTRSPFVFHLLIENQGLVERLVSYCHDQLGYTHFAVLHPNDRYGNRLSKVFSDTVATTDVDLVANISYQPGTTDFKEAINGLISQAKPNPYGQDNKSAIEALFIPDQAQTVALIAPQLPYYNMIVPTLVGTNLWDDPALLKIGGAYVENALFATAFPLTDTTPSVTRFRSEFQQAYGTPPHYFEAQAYDAVTLLLTARDHGRAVGSSRIALQQNLLNLTSPDSLTGIMAFRPDGVPERDYVIYKIENGAAVQVSP